MEDPPTSLVTVGRRYWRFFIASWLFPIAFLGLFTGAPRLMESRFASLVWMPVFFISFAFANAPGLLGWVKQRYTMFWGIVVPFCIWTIAVFARLAVLSIIGH